MAWLFSKALINSLNSPCSLVAAAEFSAGNSLAGDALEPWKLKDIHAGYSPKDKTTGALILSRFGMTFSPSDPTTQSAPNSSPSSNESAIDSSSAVDFLARTSAWQAQAQASKENEADSGKNTPEWFAKLDPLTSGWKIRQLWLFEDLEQSLRIWTKWGTMHAGECFPLLTLAHDTSVKGFGASNANETGLQRSQQRTARGLFTLDNMASPQIFPQNENELPKPELLGSGHGMANYMDRIKCIGNGQVPAVVALAWRTLMAVHD